MLVVEAADGTEAGAADRHVQMLNLQQRADCLSLSEELLLGIDDAAAVQQPEHWLRSQR